MELILQTVTESLAELLGSAVKVLPGLLSALIILFLTRYLAEFVRDLSSRVGEALPSRSLQLLVGKSSFIAAWVIGILLAAVVGFPGLELGDIIASLGLGSVAIGFAFQDIFKNFLAGILLLLQEPFRLGDEIVVESYEGTVEQIDIRTTRIRTYQGEQVLVPNATVFTSAVQVRTAYNTRRTDLGVGVDYNTSLPRAKRILGEVIRGMEGVLDTPKPEIDLVNFGDSSIDFVVRYWTQPQQKEVRRVQTDAIVAIKRALDEANISIPYPIRTVYHFDQQKFSDYQPTEDTNHLSAER